MQLTLACRVRRAQHRRPPEPHCLTRHKTIHPAARCKIAKRFAGESNSLTPAAISMPMRPGRRSGCDRPSRRRHSCKGSFRSPRPFTITRAAILAARTLCSKQDSRVWLVSRTRTTELRWALCARKRRRGPRRWPVTGSPDQRSPSPKSNLQWTIEARPPAGKRRRWAALLPRLRKSGAGIAACRTSPFGTADEPRA